MVVAGTTSLTTIKTLLLLSLAVLPVSVGCSGGENSQASTSGNRIQAIYSGELRMDIAPDTVGRQTVDTLNLYIDFDRYRVTMITNRANLCDVGGTVAGFGGDAAIFTITDTLPIQCDSLHVLRGSFPTLFEGDSLIMTKFDPALNTSFDFRLSK